MTCNGPQPPPLQGIHHLKLPVSDLDTSLTFYERAFGARRIPEADHRRVADGSLYAYILTVPGLGTALELRLDPERAERHRLFDPVTIAVRDRATLDAWDEYLTGQGIVHSEVHFLAANRQPCRPPTLTPGNSCPSSPDRLQKHSRRLGHTCIGIRVGPVCRGVRSRYWR